MSGHGHASAPTAMTELSSAWITGLLMAGMAIVVVYFIVKHDWLPWRAYLRDMRVALGGRPEDGAPIRFDHGGRPCELTMARARHGPAQFCLVVQADVGETLALYRKGSGDVMAASAGFVVPLATGYPEVDRQWVIGFDDAARATKLLADPGVRSSLGALLRARARRVVWSAEDRAVSVRGDIRRDVTWDLEVLEQALRLAVQSSRPLPFPSSAPWPRRRAFEAETHGAAVNTLVLVAIALPALATLPVIGLDMAYPPLDRSIPFWAAAAFALAVTASLYRPVQRLARQRVPDHRPALFVLPTLAVGLWVLGYGAIVGINGAADTAEPVVVKGRIQTPIQPAYGSPREHRLQTTKGRYVVSETVHEQARPGDRLHVSTRPGRLGIAWRDPQDDIALVRRH
jgi:hypothetical protein